MAYYYLGLIVGAALFTYLWSRLWLFVVRKVGRQPDPRRLWFAYGLAWVTAIILGGFGYADGGPWRGAYAALVYTPGLAFWLVMDVFAARWRGQ